MEATLDPGQMGLPPASSASGEILDEIAALEVERARIEAKIAAKMLDFADLRRRQAESRTDDTACRLEASFAADELGIALHQPTRTVQCRLAEARRVRGRLPQTWLAFRAGKIDTYRITLITSAVDKLRDNHAVIELDYRVTDYATTRTTAQLKGWLKRFVTRNAPSQAAVRTEHQKRSVWFDHQDDGMSYLHAYLPTPDAVRLDQLLTTEAKKLPSDERTLGQKRADEFTRQMLSAGEGQSTSSRAVIAIAVPVTSLAWVTDEPGESFDGSFALPADLVRDLAQEPGTLFHRVMTDPLGHILDVTEFGRFASAKLKIAIDIRDGTCRFPTCSRPAMESDLDHQIPHPRGPTNAANLRALCRRHHNMKTYGVTEPTNHVMRERAASRAEHDLATFMVHMQYAA